MAKKQITKKTRLSILKKRWYTIHAPALFQESVIAETLTADPALLVGRIVRVNLASLLRGSKRQTVEVRFRITNVQGNACQSAFVGFDILPPYVKRLTKRARRRAEDSFMVETKDAVRLRVKPMLLVRDRVQVGVLTALRHASRTYVEATARELPFSEFLTKALTGDLARDLKTAVKKVYPVVGAEIRAMVLPSFSVAAEEKPI